MKLCGVFFSGNLENRKIYAKFIRDCEIACNDLNNGKQYVSRTTEINLLKTFINEVNDISSINTKDHFLVVCDVCYDKELIKYLFELADQISDYYDRQIKLDFSYIDHTNYYSTDNTGILFSPIIVTYYSSGEHCFYNAKSLEDATEFENNYQKYVENAEDVNLLTVANYKV